ncbi:hypothetical protein P3S68_002860 [Capsicum galapagoense]
MLIYEDTREIVVPPSPHVDIFIAPMSRLQSIIYRCTRPKIISVLPCTNSKLLQELPELKWCRKGCSFSVECSYCLRELKEVDNVVDLSSEETAAWYSWLNSAFLIDKVTNFLGGLQRK